MVSALLPHLLPLRRPCSGPGGLLLVALACLPLGMAGDLSALNMQLEALRAEVQAQQQLIGDQASKLDAYAQSRRLQTYVSQTDYDTAVAQLKSDDYSLGGAMDSAWLCLCGALVMFMHAGFAMLETGSCRAKNASNVLMKNLVNVTFGTIGWWVFGWAFAYGTLSGGFIGTDGFFGIGFYTKDANDVITPNSCDADGCQSTMLSWFFQWAFCTAGATIVSGGVAERVKSPTYAAYAFVMTSFIYPVVVAWTWNYGWLDTIFDVGYMDFAGSGIVHLTAGVSALAGTIVLGPRTGRFVNPEEFEPHNLPLVVLGTFALWFGWYGFNPGSTLGMHTGDTGAMAAQVAMNTTISAATGGLTVFMLRFGIYKKYDVGGLCNGILAGLVSITAPCGNVECGSAFAIGFIGALVYQGASMLLQKLKIDDPVDASPVHGFCGVWGLLAAGLFDWGKGFDHYHAWNGFSCKTVSETDSSCMTGIGGRAIAAQAIMALVIIAWAGTLSGLAFFALKMTGKLRIDEETEEAGMDLKQHSPPKAYAIGQAPPKEKQLEQGKEELEKVMTGKTVVFNDYSWSHSDSQESIEKKMQQAWDATEREENHALLKEVAAILKKYPSLTLRLKGISSGRGQNNHITEAAFTKDFEKDFPSEPMEKREPYAHGRVLSIKRMLVKEGIKPDRMVSEIVVASGSKVEMTVE